MRSSGCRRGGQYYSTYSTIPAGCCYSTVGRPLETHRVGWLPPENMPRRPATARSTAVLLGRDEEARGKLDMDPASPDTNQGVRGNDGIRWRQRGVGGWQALPTHTHTRARAPADTHTHTHTHTPLYPAYTSIGRHRHTRTTPRLLVRGSMGSFHREGGGGGGTVPSVSTRPLQRIIQTSACFPCAMRLVWIDAAGRPHARRCRDGCSSTR